MSDSADKTILELGSILAQSMKLLSEPALVLDPDTLILSVNPAAEATLGICKSEVVTQPCAKALGARGYGQTIARVARQAVQTGKEASARLSAARQGWEGLRWTIRGAPVRLAGRGSSLVVVAFTLEGPRGGRWVRGFVDKSERDSPEEFRVLLDLLPDIVFEVDSDGRVLYANGMAVELLGYPAEDTQKLNITDLLHPEEGESLLSLLQAMIGGELVHRNMPYKLVRADGTVLPVEVNAIVIQGPDSKPRVLGIARDHSQRLRLEERLRQSEARYKSLFDSSRDVIFSVDERGITLEMNRAGVALTGKPRHKMIGRPFVSLLDEESGVSFEQALACTRSGEGADVEVVFLGARQSRSVAEVALAPVREDGRLIEVHGTARDVTERRRMRRQIETVQRMESLGRLAAGVAHDFNNVLGAVLGLASVLEVNLPWDHRCRADLAGIVQAARQGSELTRQILSFSRGATRRDELIRMDELVSEVVSLLGRTIPESVTIDLDVQPDAPAVVADPGQLRQVVMNLCVNAADAMSHDGTIRIRVNGRRRWPSELGAPVVESPMVELTISDDGPGIPDSERPHIFEPFYTTKAQDRGLGLGLSVCWGIVKDHRGHIDVESAVGNGSTFRVLLPAATGSCEKKSEPKGEEPPIDGGVALVVDDQEPMLRAAQRMLEMAGYKVHCATHWRELTKVLDDLADQPQLALLDLGLPDVDGLTIYRRLKQRFPKMYVIAVSGYSYEGAAQQMLEEGAQEFIQKPFTWRDLREALGRVKGESRGEA